MKIRCTVYISDAMFVKFKFFSLSVKYNRIADYNETVIENENFIGLKQVAVLAGANFVRFLPLLITVAAFEPTNYKSIKVRAYAITNEINYLR